MEKGPERDRELRNKNAIDRQHTKCSAPSRVMCRRAVVAGYGARIANTAQKVRKRTSRDASSPSRSMPPATCGSTKQIQETFVTRFHCGKHHMPPYCTHGRCMGLRRVHGYEGQKKVFAHDGGK